MKNNINWLAQCKKRMHYPVDRSDRAGLTAFEYGWKSFNSLYSEFKSGSDREKMRVCVGRYIASENFVCANKEDLLRFCDIQHRIYMSDGQYDDLNPKLGEQVKNLRNSIRDGRHEDAVSHLLTCLYIIRNARIHGAFGTGEVRFSFLPKIIYQINIFILSSRFAIPVEILESAVNAELDRQRRERMQSKALLQSGDTATIPA